ncbi:transposase [Streptomyces sp. NPDC086787]|uniref:transposase n=1 Tax=Streptomyces sp. NPDC086787 TaxID=3365759 RepID=UPI00382F0227
MTAAEVTAVCPPAARSLHRRRLGSAGTHVAIDMSATYRAAIRPGLPDAVIVVDHLRIVQLANKMVSAVRRRTTAEVRD